MVREIKCSILDSGIMLKTMCFFPLEIVRITPTDNAFPPVTGHYGPAKVSGEKGTFIPDDPNSLPDIQYEGEVEIEVIEEKSGAVIERIKGDLSGTGSKTKFNIDLAARVSAPGN
jgi:hypothetical protein